MTHPGYSAFVLYALSLAAVAPLAGQSVVSTHSGVLYFFTGDVFLQDKPVQQQFGRFPDIEQGGELRTGVGRAEVLLTPGVFLRIDQNSSIRMLSTSFSDTRVELLRGSAILEVTESTPGSSVALIYQNWRVRVPQKGVCRIDASLAHVRAYEGEAVVGTNGAADGVTVHKDETLTLAAVLVRETSTNAGNDDFKYWAMLRSQAIAADNTIAAGIVDDPGQTDPSGAAAGGYTWFPATGIPSADIGDPYGLSFWSPFHSTITAVYFQPYFYSPVYLIWGGGRQRPPARVISSGRGMPYPPRVGSPRVGFPRVGSPLPLPPRVAPPRVGPPRVAPPVYRPAPLPSTRVIVNTGVRR